MRKRIQLEPIQKVWDRLWAEKLERRGTDHDWRGDTYYVTAMELEREIRETAQREGGWAVRIYTGRGSLLNAVRDWLDAELRAGRLTRHNFGRGHISGARYRPAGEPIGPQEAKTMAAKERRKGRPRPRHYWQQWGGTLLCQKPRNRFRWGRTKSLGTSTATEVTCHRCLKLLNQKQSA